MSWLVVETTPDSAAAVGLDFVVEEGGGGDVTPATYSRPA